MPPLTALRAFVTTAKEGGFSAAARKLNVTHAAIAQQVRALEADLGVPLVWRDGKHLALTPEGQRFAEALGEGFATILSAADHLRATGSEKPLAVTVPPTFASEWLMPRLARFWKKHPDIALSLLPEARVVDLQTAGANLGLRFGVGKWRGVVSEFLTAAPQVVVAAPELLGGRTRLSLREMSVLPWIREGDWPEQMQLLESMGLKPAALKFVDFPNEELALAAAREGIGLHLETESLIQEDLKLGWLVKIHELTEESLGYYIVRPPGPVNPAAKTFIEWLKAEV
ncbi:LysR family glycine cleavage system transcriptional activator [Rhodobacter aestuarii]|uniref:LysR family transcriptional regulator, glycine cleavage system transcriptional activator n=2 Tax=Rhodobacter aestuarii TaxID=453582 RepID=A0A1N7LGW6_9RHOB|nr:MULTISPECIES: LysR family transcriptional regulator [Rhodobacter]PTV95261.1 LysR family glycine cleavage system transcriptional activator [Rhodobacter aestuarii]SIS73044.1 LysR family transcriptional regulator, glycine cleavage system transcriptional activator [Rhodobacter aestuarii]SOC08059.1 LysR family glycine cleavage system transcriptional activator [Rhodobacter sp. JA431]